MAHRRFAAALLLASIALGGVARAEDPAAAQALFSDAKKLMTAGKYAEACPKLEESERIAPATGTKFNLADCYEHTGRIASAWAAFLSVASSAKNANQGAREKAARDRAAALEPKLSRLAVVIPDGTRVEGIEVKRDGELVGAAEWGESMPVDPGQHTVTASAPGKRAWKAIVEVAGNGGTAKVILPPLDDEPASVAPTLASPASASVVPASAPVPAPVVVESSNAALGWVLVGAGGASVLGGAIVWAMRGGIESRLQTECGADGQHCPASATDDIANGKTYTALGVGLFALGGVCLATGAGLLVFGHHGKSAQPATASLVPAFDARSAGLRLVGTF